MGKEGAKPGKAFVFLTAKDSKFCSMLQKHLKQSDEEVLTLLLMND